MSRVFWMVVGAAGGVMAYRKGTQAAHRARELGPLGTAQVAAHATSRLAGRTAQGLGRLQDIKAQREGRLVIGSAEEVSVVRPPSLLVADDEWIPVPERRPGPPARASRTATGTSSTGAPSTGVTTGAPSGTAAPAGARSAPRTSRARRA